MHTHRKREGAREGEIGRELEGEKEREEREREERRNRE